MEMMFLLASVGNIHWIVCLATAPSEQNAQIQFSSTPEVNITQPPIVATFVLPLEPARWPACPCPLEPARWASCPCLFQLLLELEIIIQPKGSLLHQQLTRVKLQLFEHLPFLPHKATPREKTSFFGIVPCWVAVQSAAAIFFSLFTFTQTQSPQWRHWDPP